MSSRAPDPLWSVKLLGLKSWGLKRIAPPTPVEVPASPVAESPAPSKPPMRRARGEGAKANCLESAARVVSQCQKCGLAQTRNQTVYGVGTPDARVMFVGEAPGAEEDRQGLPFVGAAGQLLDRILAAMQLDRSQVYIANILKCRPPGNRNPTPDEVGQCGDYLVEQIRTIEPEAIVALGRPAANFLLGTQTALNRLRGRVHNFEGIPVYVTYHPAYLLRNPSAKKLTWADLQPVIRGLTEGFSRAEVF